MKGGNLDLFNKKKRSDSLLIASVFFNPEAVG
jgi:hypothetical protein